MDINRIYKVLITDILYFNRLINKNRYIKTFILNYSFNYIYYLSDYLLYNYIFIVFIVHFTVIVYNLIFYPPINDVYVCKKTFTYEKYTFLNTQSFI